MGRKRTVRIALWFLLLLVTSCGDEAPKSVVPTAATVAPPTTAEIIAALMPSVVLLLATQEDGRIGFGSGLIVSGDGLVVTNHHVVANATKLEALLYDPTRPSYTPMDGGVERYVFENARALVEVTVEKTDPTGDLAIVRVRADTSKAPLFRAARGDPKLGEHVIALGHPQEGLWSYTAGEVSGIRTAMIQHDALIGHGSSGGPLVNANGEVVGINTAMVVSESRGLSFARPIAMAVALLDGSRGADLDASTPAQAALTGWRLGDLGSAATADTMDWENKWRVHRATLAAFEASGLAPDDAKALVEKADAPNAREAWIAKRRDQQIASLRAPLPSCDSLGEVSKMASPRARAIVEEAKKYELAQRRATNRFTNLRVNLFDNCETAGFHAVMRLGMRVDRAREVAPDLAWVVIAGRNLDRTAFTFSELYVRSGAIWVQREYPSAEEIALLPPRFPPPLETFDRERRTELAELVAKYVK